MNYYTDPELSANGRNDARNGVQLSQGKTEDYYRGYGSEIRKQKKEKLGRIALHNHTAMWEGLGPDGVTYPAEFSIRVMGDEARSMRKAYDNALSDRVALLIINENWACLGRLLGVQARDYLLSL